MTPWFQPAAVVVLALAYALSFAARPRDQRRRYALECLAIAAAAWTGEESCIRLYGFYGYSPDFRPMLSLVPALVVAIWPMVVQSARAVVSELWPDVRGIGRMLLLALVVLIDASLMEVIAVGHGLWSWTVPGYFGVPIVGVLGWVFFSVAIATVLDRGRSPGLAAPLAIVATHALLLASWWGCLRWVLRDDLGPWALAGFAPLPLTLLALAWRSGRSLSTRTVVARVAAASVFFVLLAEQRGEERFAWLVTHTALVAAPYVVVSFPRKGTPTLAGRA